MWDTKTTDFNIMNTPYGKDIVKDYVDACRRHGIKVGYYFSPEDFHFQHEFGVEIRRVGGTGAERKDLRAYNKKQLDELFGNYGPIDVVFFDGGEKEKLAQYIHQIATQVPGHTRRDGNARTKTSQRTDARPLGVVLYPWQPVAVQADQRGL